MIENEKTKYIDYVIIFNDATPEKFLKKVKPSIHCKGGNYSKVEQLPEYDIIRKIGGEIKKLGQFKKKLRKIFFSNRKSSLTFLFLNAQRDVSYWREELNQAV